MNIGIITFHRAQNYGAVLQCYALQEYLRSLGHNVNVIDYKDSKMLACYKIFDTRKIKSKNPIKIITSIYREVSLVSLRKKRKTQFEKFITNRLSLSSYESHNLKNFDAIIIGSDQVWNTKITMGFSDPYWGNLDIRKDARLIAYSASIEQFWDEQDDQKVKKLLHKFYSISVREKNDAIKLSEIINRQIFTTVDPTFLLGKDKWNSIALKIKEPNYIFSYQVRPIQLATNIACSLAKFTKNKVISLSANIYSESTKKYEDASPETFLGLIKNANIVVCTSFHGVVFSLLFEKDFYYVLQNDGKDGRILNMLDEAKLRERAVSAVPEKITSINYLKVNNDIKNIIQKSKDYLITNCSK